MKDKVFAKIANGTLIPKQPRYDVPAHFDPITEQEQQEIDFCLNCKKEHCKGTCRDFQKFSRSIREKKQ